MVDKLDVRIPADAKFSPEFQPIYADTRGDAKYWREDLHYTVAGDLRPFGYDAVLRIGLKHGKHGEKGHPHKLELIDTGQAGYGRWKHEISRIFDIPSARKKSAGSETIKAGVDSLGIIRTDLCADLENVPVDWFHHHMRIMWKRRRADVGYYEDISSGEGRTLYFGKRPNCFRVYNKTAELKNQHAKMARQLERDCSPDQETLPIPTFEQAYQMPLTRVLTRVERQIGGGRIPEHINTIGRLKNLSHYDPFSVCKFLSGTQAVPSMEKYGPKTYWAGMWLRQMVLEAGLHRTEQIMRMADKSNFSRNRELFAEFLAVSNENGISISSEKLTEIYRDSVSKQLAA